MLPSEHRLPNKRRELRQNTGGTRLRIADLARPHLSSALAFGCGAPHVHSRPDCT
jgi:hypothetical protein